MRRTLWQCKTIDVERGYGESFKEEVRTQVVDIKEANLVGSMLWRDTPESPIIHAPVIDLDIPHHLEPSTTPGHSHLYLDIEMTWWQYRGLLRALWKAGIIEKGFYKMSLKRKQSFVRAPGVKKMILDKFVDR